MCCCGGCCGCAGPPIHWTAQNFALFSLSRLHFRTFSLFGCLLIEFWWCFRKPGNSNVTVWALELWCETSAASGPPASHNNPPNVHSRAFPNNNQNSTRRKGTKMEAGEGKKKAKIWVPTLRGPTFSKFGPSLRGTTPRGSTMTIQKWIGQICRGQNSIGQSWSLPVLLPSPGPLRRPGFTK